MKISKGYVAVTAEGAFIYISLSQSHVGTRCSFEEVLELEQATFCPGPNFGFLERDYRSEAGKYKFVPVERRVEVILQGFGLPK